MSATPDDDACRYDNPETKAQLDEARQQLEAQSTADDIAAAATAAEARSEMAGEAQPGRDLPDLTETMAVDFRGEEFEFAEAGGSFLDALSRMADNPDDVDAEDGFEIGEYIYGLLGEKATHPDADEAYWRQYDLHREDTDGVIDLFHRLVGEAAPDADEMDDEAVEAVDDFPGE